VNQRYWKCSNYRRNKLIPPESKIPYNLAVHSLKAQGPVELVIDYFGNKTNGVFIEASALDGEEYSYTLFLEKELGWTGLLVEPNITIFKRIVAKNRKAYVTNSCLSTSNHPEIVQNSNGKNKIECFPLYSLLLAMGAKKIDFLSLDIRTVDTKLLRAIPWDKVQIESGK